MSKQKCPSCGEYELEWVQHFDEDSEGRPAVKPPVSEEPHQYCTNCDYGACQDC